MDISFSIDWIFIGLTLGCVLFLLQMVLEYNRQTTQIRPQIQHAKEVQSKHVEELKKVELLLAESQGEEDGLEKRIADLDKRHKELLAVMNQAEEEQENEK
ncbi:MAG: hypothetical protein O2954_09720 [bacterium]|nr:hypothetical protein [bacterium]